MTTLDDAIGLVGDALKYAGVTLPDDLVRAIVVALRPDLVIVEAPVVQVSSDLAGLAEREASR